MILWFFSSRSSTWLSNRKIEVFIGKLIRRNTLRGNRRVKRRNGKKVTQTIVLVIAVWVVKVCRDIKTKTWPKKFKSKRKCLLELLILCNDQKSKQACQNSEEKGEREGGGEGGNRKEENNEEQRNKYRGRP